jgi:hypothetical protein
MHTLAAASELEYRLLWSFGTSLNFLESSLRAALDRQKGKETMALPDAVDLLRKYFGVQAYRSFQPLIAALSDEDDQHRYIIDKDIRVRTTDGATACVLVVPPTSGRFFRLSFIASHWLR